MEQEFYTQNAGTVPPQGYAPAPGTYPPYGAPRPPYAPKLKWPPILGDAFDTVFMILTLIFAVFAIHSVFFAGFFKLGFTVAYCLWFVLESIYVFTKNKPKFSVYPILLGLLSLGASGVFALYNDEAVNFSLLVFIAFANAEYFLLLSKQDRFAPGEITAVLDAARFLVIIPIQFFTEPFRSAFAASKGEAKKGKAKSTIQVLIGLAIAIPIAAVLIALLSGADEAFKGLIDKLFANVLLSLLKLVLGIFLFPILLAPAFALRYKLPNREYKPLKARNLKRFPSAVSMTILAVVSLVYLVYLFSQLAYFFDAFKGILPENFSASSYARRGFFEMCAICAINVVFIALSMAFAKHDSKGSEVCHKVFQIFISVVSLVIAASSFSKMYMYIQMYGLTRKRILTSVFILMLSIVFISLIVRILVKKFPYLKVIAVCCFAIMIAVGYADIDSNIAKYNYNLYKNDSVIAAHYQKDGAFIDQLGDSAASYVAKFAEEGKGDVQKRAQAWMSVMWAKENRDYYEGKLSKCETPLSFNKARKESTVFFNEFNEQHDFAKYWDNALDVYGDGYEDYDEFYEAYQSRVNEYCYDYNFIN